MTTKRVYLDFADIRTNPNNMNDARDSANTYVSTVCAYARKDVRMGFVYDVLAYFDAGIRDHVSFKDVYAQTIAYATDLLMVRYFGVLDVETAECSEIATTIADMRAFTRACGGRL